MATANCLLGDFGRQGVVANDPYVQCRARTLIFLSTEEEVDVVVNHHGPGSIFWSKEGILTQTAKNLYKATAYGLGYDLAANVFVCGKCRSSCTQYRYFIEDHFACDKLVEKNCAYIKDDKYVKVVEAFPIMPSYATPGQEARIIQWMNKTSQCLADHCIQRAREITFTNSKTQEEETRVKDCSMEVFYDDFDEAHAVIEHAHRKNPVHEYKEKQLRMTSNNIAALVDQVTRMMHSKGKTVEIVGSKGHKKFAKIPLKHTMGYPKRDWDATKDIPEDFRGFITTYSGVIQYTRKVQDHEVTLGWSGVLLSEMDVPDGYQEDCVDGLFIVMGRCAHGRIQNALKPKCTHGLRWYGDQAVNKAIPKYHDVCNNNCASYLEALPRKVSRVWQSMFDIHNLRCDQCRTEWKMRTASEHLQLLQKSVEHYMQTYPDSDVTLFKAFLQALGPDEEVEARQLKPNNTLQLVDVWRTMKNTINIPNRIIYMGMFTDNYGNFDFFPNTSMPELFAMHMQPVQHKMLEDGTIETNFRFVDLEGKIQTSIESLYPTFDSTYWNEQARRVHRIQPLADCSMEINGESKPICHWEGNVPLYNPIIRATPGQLPFGVTTHLLSVNDRSGRFHYVPKNGYCYMYIFACAMIFCGNSNRSTVDAFVRQVCEDLGPWPTFGDVLRQLDWMATFYGCYDALVPVILVDHTRKTMHVPTPYGIKQSGMHTIRVNTVLELITLDTMASGAMKDYKIGGFQETVLSIQACVKSRKEFVRKINKDAEWLVDMFINPSTLFVLGGLIEVHQVILADVENSFDKSAALLNLRQIALKLGPHLESKQRVRQYMELMIQHRASVEAIIPSQHMKAEMMQYIDALQRSILEEQVIIEMDRVGGKEKMLVEQDLSHAECAYNEFFNSIGYLNFHGTVLRLTYSGPGRKVGEVLESLRDNWLTRYLRGPKQPRDYKGSSLRIWRKVTHLCGNAYRWVFYNMAANVLQVILIGLSTVFGAYLLKKILKMLQWEKEQESTELVEYQGKREEAWITRVMAVLYIIASLFSVDFSSALYSNLVKFRTIFDILKFNCEYQSGIFESLKNQLGNIPAFHEVHLYDHEATQVAVPPAILTFERWFETRITSGQQGYAPLDGSHVSLTMTKDTVGEIATQVQTHKAKEFLIIGHVGCGKSTAFPATLSRNGRVMICEPTRVLVTNLQDSMLATRNLSISAMMRNHRVMTASNITVTTYGYALHYLYNNSHNLSEYDYILFDEVHQTSAEMLVFYNWLKSTTWEGKLIKLTATNNTVNGDMQTQQALDVKTWPVMDHRTFMQEQGRGTAHDASTLGDVIIVFLTSFREIDESADILSKNSRIGVIKADSRHLRNKVSLMDDVEALRAEKKYILATNILQNGVNLHADVVVDFGFKIVPAIDSDNRMITVKRQLINKSDRIQRLGRVGRMKMGYARKIGNEIDASFALDEVTATEAALLAFGLGVAPVLQNVDQHTFGKITAEQVRTAARFEMQLSYMVWMINRDGTMATRLYEQFKSLLLTPGNTSLAPYYETLVDTHRFRTIGQYATLGYMRTDEKHHLVLPFHHNDVSVEFAERIGEAYMASQVPTSIKLRVPAVNHREVAMKMSANPEDVGTILYMVEQALISEKTKLENLTQAFQQQQSTYCSVLIPNFNVAGRLTQAMDRIRKNVSVLQHQKTALEKAAVTYDYTKLVELLDENPSIASHVSYQAGPAKFIDEFILEKRDYGWLPYLAVGTACAIAGTTLVMMYYRRMKRSVKFEGKAARNRSAKRQSARDQKMERGNEYTYYDAGDTLYNGVQENMNHAPDWTDRIKKKTHAYAMQFGREVPKTETQRSSQYWHFYGFDPKMYDSVEFKDIAANFSVHQDAKAMDLQKAFTEMVENRWDDEDFFDEKIPKRVLAIFRKGDKVREVALAPHKPNQVNKRGLPVGHADHRGEWRQTQPSFEKEVSYENKSTFEGARSLDHIHQNQVILVEDNQQLNGLIVGNILLAPYHFTRGMRNREEKETRMLTQFGTYNLGKLTNKHVTKFTMMDLVALTLPPTFQARRKLKCFRPPREGERAMLVTMQYEKAGWVAKQSAETTITPFGDRHDGLWKHRISTGPGDCGSAIVAVADLKVVGFHNLGGKGENYFTPITVEVMDFLAEKSVTPLVPWKFSDEQVDLCGLIAANGADKYPFTKTISDLVSWQSLQMTKYCGENFKAIAYAPNRMSKRHVITGKRPEFIKFLDSHPKWNAVVTPFLNEFQPSVLTHEAYYKDVLKYNKDIIVGGTDEVCFAKAVVATIGILEIAGFSKGQFQPIFDGCKIFNDLNLDAAMGALYSGKKSAYFDGATSDEINEFFELSAAKLLSNGHGVWSGLLKAELRPKAKVVANKTRTFTSAPIDILMGAKAVVDEFNKFFYTKHLRGPWTVGINKFNGGWDLLAKNLMVHEWFIDADGSQFDSSITPLLMNAILNIRQYFMAEDDEAEQMLANLYTQIINTCILIEDGTIVQKFRGNNSGQPSTVVDNTMCLIIAMEYCRMRVEKDHGHRMRILYVCNGDDLLINADTKDKDFIQQYFADYMRELELNYSFDEAYRSIEEVEYMSHTFMKRNSMYIPKLKRERIVAILEWQRSKEPKAIQSAIIAAYVEAFGYDEFTEMIEELAQEVSAVWPDFKLPSRQEVEDLYLTGTRTDLGEEIKECGEQYCVYESSEAATDAVLAAANAGTGSASSSGSTQSSQSASTASGSGSSPSGSGSGAAGGSSSGSAQTQSNNVSVMAGIDTGGAKTGQGSGSKGTGGSFTSNPVRTGGRATDVQDQTPGLVFPAPKITTKAIYMPKTVRDKIKPEMINNMIKYQPRAELIDNRYATTEQLNTWIKEASEGLDVTEDVFINTLLPGWVYHCIINTTSPENRALGTWRVVNNAGKDNEQQLEFKIEPMYKAAKPSLRAIMRHFGEGARVMIEESVRIGKPIIPRGFDKAGVLSINNIVAACDFIMRGADDTPNFVQVQNSVAVNRLRGIQNKLFAQARLSAGTNEDNSRHDADDVRENTHSFNGVNALA
uniref:Genome polyprotein n=1 Tax=Wheat streak mosaic virus TaxID=31741 RepID=A0A650E6L1_9POTY|nr:polyprotein [Wheat streak mosaic virus]